MGCGDISIGSAFDCANPLQGGTIPRVVLFNKADIVSTTAGTTPGLITAITLASGKSGYAFEGFRNSNTPTVEKKSATSGQALYKHQLNFFVYENTQLAKNNIEKMGNGSFVAMIINAKPDAQSFELLGLGNGLFMADGVINNKVENNGAYNIIMASLDTLGEAKLPQTLFVTDYSTTLALVNGYLFLPTVTVISDLTISTAGGDAEAITGTNFYGSGSSPDVISVSWVNQSTLLETTQTAVTVASNTSLTFSSVALAAGSYKLRVKTSKGTADSSTTVVVS